jgi:hypothetical protein
MAHRFVQMARRIGGTAAKGYGDSPFFALLVVDGSADGPLELNAEA